MLCFYTHTNTPPPANNGLCFWAVSSFSHNCIPESLAVDMGVQDAISCMLGMGMGMGDHGEMPGEFIKRKKGFPEEGGMGK